MEFLCRALTVPDAAAGGGSSRRLSVDRAFSALMLPLYGCSLYWNTYSVCGLGFGKLHVQLDIWCVVRGLLGDASVTTRLPKIILHGQ